MFAWLLVLRKHERVVFLTNALPIWFHDKSIFGLTCRTLEEGNMDHVKLLFRIVGKEPKRQPSWLFQYCLNPQNIPHCRKIQTLVNIIDRGKIFYLKHFWGCLIFRVAALNSIKTQVAVTPTLIKRALHHRLVHFYPLFCRKNKTCYLTCSITSNLTTAIHIPQYCPNCTLCIILAD